VIPILAGLTAALCWGLSTVVASRSTRILGSQQALAYVMLLGLAALAVIAPATGLPAHVGPGALAWAVGAGVGSAIGLSLLYRAVRLGRVGVVTPIASTEGAVAAVLSIALGERLTLSVALCLAVVALGVVVVTLRGSAADVQLRVADAITAFAGSMKFVYLHVVVFGVWMLVLEKSPWPMLTLIVSLEAIFLSTFVMIGQNRSAAFQQQKADHGFNSQPRGAHKRTDRFERGSTAGRRTGVHRPTTPAARPAHPRRYRVGENRRRW